MSGIPSSSSRHPAHGIHTIPRPCVTMKLTSSGVAAWAAITKSPSFSRSASSTTITILPARISSTASPIESNATCTVASAMPNLWHEPLHVLRDHVDLQVHRVAGPGPPERRELERVRDERHAEPVPFDSGDRQADAVHRDRPLLHEI